MTTPYLIPLQTSSTDAASGLRAGVAHRDAADLETLATIATGHGLRLTVAGSRAADGRLMSEVELQGAAP